MLFLFVILLCFGQVYSETWTVLVGAETQDESWQLANFYPTNLVIEEGDTVMWVANAHDIYSVIFTQNRTLLISTEYNNKTGITEFLPVNGSALFPLGPSNFTSPNITYSSGTMSLEAGGIMTYSLTFGIVGIFVYSDTYHYPFMNGSIIVLPKSTASIALIPPATVSNNADSLIQEQIVSLLPLVDIIKGRFDTVPTSRNGTANSTIWTVRIVSDTIVTNGDLVRFLPSNFTVSVGDTVEFVSDSISYHNVAFNSSNVFSAGVIVENGVELFNPEFNRISSNATYNGGFVSSGILYPMLFSIYLSNNNVNDLSIYPNGWNITFEAAGTFPFTDVFHNTVGMNGQVTVVPK